jgi:hypothetical protein
MGHPVRTNEGKKWLGVSGAAEFRVAIDILYCNFSPVSCSMRFVRETHSIEVVMSGKASENTSKDTRSCFWKKARILTKKKNSSAVPTEDISSDSLGFANHSQVRARSESQCEYSPQKRNTAQMLQKRGLANPLGFKSQPYNNTRRLNHRRQK